MSFAFIIKKKREQLNLKQKDVAKELSVSPGMYSQVEKGESMFSKDNLVKLNKILKFEDNFLIDLAEKEEETKSNNINNSRMEGETNWEQKYNALHRKYSKVLEQLLEYKDKEIREGKEPGHQGTGT